MRGYAEASLYRIMSKTLPLSPYSPEYKGISTLNIIYEAGKWRDGRKAAFAFQHADQRVLVDPKCCHRPRQRESPYSCSVCIELARPRNHKLWPDSSVSAGRRSQQHGQVGSFWTFITWCIALLSHDCMFIWAVFRSTERDLYANFL